MEREPILRSGRFGDRIVKAYGGLHYIKGNRVPYFTLTMGSWRVARNGRRVEDCFGAAHEEIVEHWPELADLAALHLSDWDGVPMHAEANGWYWLAGAIGGAGERYHGGNGSGSGKTAAECLQVFADYVRISPEEAQQIATAAREQGRDYWKAKWTTYADRWKREAEDCTKKHGLKVFGDLGLLTVEEARERLKAAA